MFLRDIAGWMWLDYLCPSFLDHWSRHWSLTHCWCSRSYVWNYLLLCHLKKIDTGPGYIVRKGTFEDRIFYGNHVSLNEDRWDCLKSIVKQCKTPIPYYVSTVTRSAVIRGKSKMVNTWTFLFANHTSLVKMPSCRDREEDGRGCANHTYFFYANHTSFFM